MPRTRPRTWTVEPSNRAVAAIGGRLGPETPDVLAREHGAHRAPGAVGELARGEPDRGRDLAAERTAIGERARELRYKLAFRPWLV